jgi:hypothetical protein
MRLGSVLAEAYKQINPTPAISDIRSRQSHDGNMILSCCIARCRSCNSNTHANVTAVYVHTNSPAVQCTAVSAATSKRSGASMNDSVFLFRCAAKNARPPTTGRRHSVITPPDTNPIDRTLLAKDSFRSLCFFCTFFRNGRKDLDYAVSSSLTAGYRHERT